MHGGNMMKDRGPGLSLRLPQKPKGLPDFLTNSGTYKDEDIVVNLRGLKVGNEETPRMDSSSMTLSDLESIKVIGKGNSAVVRLVQNKWTNEVYALKVMDIKLDEATRAQIRKELKINHAKYEHVVECFQSFYSDGSISLVLEYMDGGSLADLLKKNITIPENYLSLISKQALLGLHSLHQAHIIHRDIKPSNLLVNRKGEVKISDFGVSAMLDSTLDQGQTFVGTYTYMSPERINAEAYSYNSDVWSLGLSILECAIGKFPYSPTDGSSTWSNFIQLLQAVVNTPSPQAPTHFSPQFQSFISNCLHKDVSQRATAIQLLNHPFIKMYENVRINLVDLMR